MIIESLCADDTFVFGKKLGETAEPGTVYTLVGDLGVGKTVLTQGLAEGLGITEAVNSPTFTILQVYEEGRLPLYHFDAYRLEGTHQELGFEEMIDGEGLTVIEWPEYMEDLDQTQPLRITLHRLGENRRQIVLETDNEKYVELMEALK